MGVPCTALWAVLFSVAWAPTGAPGPIDLLYDGLTRPSYLLTDTISWALGGTQGGRGFGPPRNKGA